MKSTISVLLLISGLVAVSAFKSFAGNNLYYAAGLGHEDRIRLLTGMQEAGMKVLRVWLDGQTATSVKTPIAHVYPDLEPTELGVYNDTVLELYDDFMLDARKFGIKLIISMHSFNVLEWGRDAYGSKYGTDRFYEDPVAITAFDNRLRHILNHKHKTLGIEWKHLDNYIFAFEAQNEAMIGSGPNHGGPPPTQGLDFILKHINWQCDRATVIKNEMRWHKDILVNLGGEALLMECTLPQWYECDALDMLSIHSYAIAEFNATLLKPPVLKAKETGKLIVMEEWGSCYWKTTDHNTCPKGVPQDPVVRNGMIQAWTDTMSSVGLPWFYWQVLPRADNHNVTAADFEIGMFDDPSWETIKNASLVASQANTIQDFSRWLP